MGLGGRMAMARAIRAWLNWCYRRTQEIEPIMQFVEFPKRRGRQLIKTLSEDELGEVFAAVNDIQSEFVRIRTRCFLMLALDTGMRAEELLSLHTGSIDIDSRLIPIVGKGGHERKVSISFMAKREVIAWGRKRSEVESPSDALFILRNGKPINYSTVNNTIRRLRLKVKIPQLSLHSFRRSFGTFAARAGMPQKTLQALLGHSSFAVSSTYYIAVNEQDLVESTKFSSADRLVSKIAWTKIDKPKRAKSTAPRKPRRELPPMETVIRMIAEQGLRSAARDIGVDPKTLSYRKKQYEEEQQKKNARGNKAQDPSD
jgi:site-specific recombinase XerD